MFGDQFIKITAISIAAIVGIGALLFLGYQGLSRSRFFLVEKIDVAGCKRTTAEQIIAWSGLDVQTNLWTIRPGKLEKILENNSWISQARIERNWPNELSIKVWERKAVAIMSRKKSLYYTDSGGTLFAEVRPGDDYDFPLITGYEEEGDETKSPGFTKALDFIKYAEKGSASLPKQNISEIHIGNESKLVVFIADNPFPISLGQGSIYTNYQQLCRVLSWLYRMNKMSTVAFIDMNYLQENESTKEMKGRTLVRLKG